MYEVHTMNSRLDQSTVVSYHCYECSGVIASARIASAMLAYHIAEVCQHMDSMCYVLKNKGMEEGVFNLSRPPPFVQGLRLSSLQGARLTRRIDSVDR